MMKGVISGFEPEVIAADNLYDFDRGLFGIDEMTEDEIRLHSQNVAQKILASL